MSTCGIKLANRVKPVPADLPESQASAGSDVEASLGRPIGFLRLIPMRHAIKSKASRTNCPGLRRSVTLHMPSWSWQAESPSPRAPWRSPCHWKHGVRKPSGATCVGSRKTWPDANGPRAGSRQALFGTRWRRGPRRNGERTLCAIVRSRDHGDCLQRWKSA